MVCVCQRWTGKKWRNTVYIWHIWRWEKLDENGMCMATFERGKAVGVWYMYCNVGEGKT